MKAVLSLFALAKAVDPEPSSITECTGAASFAAKYCLDPVLPQGYCCIAENSDSDLCFKPDLCSVQVTGAQSISKYPAYYAFTPGLFADGWCGPDKVEKFVANETLQT